jgi:hypothetical protein
MISEIKAAIINKLSEIYPAGYVIYDEELPGTASRPSFLITLTGQSYGKRLRNKFTSELSFDIAFYSDQTAARTDCIRVQEDLLRAFDFVGTYQARNKNAKITDNVLHFTFDIRYSEVKEDQSSLMQQKQIITNL